MMSREKILAAAAALLFLVLYALSYALLSLAPRTAIGGNSSVYVNRRYKTIHLPDPVGGPAGYDPVNDDPRTIPEQYILNYTRAITSVR